MLLKVNIYVYIPACLRNPVVFHEAPDEAQQDGIGASFKERCDDGPVAAFSTCFDFVVVRFESSERFRS